MNPEYLLFQIQKKTKELLDLQEQLNKALGLKTESEEDLIKYLSNFTETKEVLDELVSTLKKHGVLSLFVMEHRKQSKERGFGRCGKMRHINADRVESGIDWSGTSNGESFWVEILG